jgi:predicted DNA-binding transcriptional regulator AlpA
VTTTEILRRDRQHKQTKHEEREQRRGMRLLRPKEIQKRLGCGHTKFWADFVGTGRIRLVNVGPNAVAAPEHEVDAVIKDMIEARDAKQRNTKSEVE